MEDVLNIQINPKKLQEARRKAGYSQTQVAKMLNLSKGAVSQWECGVTVPSGNDLLRLLAAYKLATRNFFAKVV